MKNVTHFICDNLDHPKVIAPKQLFVSCVVLKTNKNLRRLNHWHTCHRIYCGNCKAPDPRNYTCYIEKHDNPARTDRLIIIVDFYPSAIARDLKELSWSTTLVELHGREIGIRNKTRNHPDEEAVSELGSRRYKVDGYTEKAEWKIVLE